MKRREKKQEYRTEKSLDNAKVMEINYGNELEDKFLTEIRGLYFIMNFLGIWSRPSPPKWYTLIWYFHFMAFVFGIFGPTAGLIIQRHDTMKIVDNISVVIPIALLWMRWVAFSIEIKTIDMILYFMKVDWSDLESNTSSISQNAPNGKRIMATYSKLANIFFYTYLTMLGLACSKYVGYFITARYSHNNTTDLDRVLPLPNSWYPVDYDRNFNIEFLAVAQTMSIMTMVATDAVVDSFFVVAILHLCGQFEILRYFIESIAYDPSRPEHCKTRIRLMVERHQALLGVGGKIQDSYGFIILSELVITVLSICLYGYKLILEIEEIDRSIADIMHDVFICGAMVQTMLLYCLVGDCLTIQSTTIATAVYNSEWYNSTRSINSSFLIVMIRAMKPVEITGAKLLAISLENFTVLMKLAVSYISVLRALGVGQGYSTN